MSINAHTAQALAADPKVSAWVAASAGTGKTKVLTDRILNLLLAGFEPEKILCLTFTKAAAAEMANRLNERLSCWAIASPPELTQDLQILLGCTPTPEIFKRARQLFSCVLDTPGGMKIQTIHGFCQSILGKFPLEAGIAPHFQILDDGRAEKLLKQALNHVLTHSREVVPALSLLSQQMGDKRFSDILDDFHGNRRNFWSVIEAHDGLEGCITTLKEKLQIPDQFDLLDFGLIDRLIESAFPQVCQDDDEQPLREKFEDYLNQFLTKSSGKPREIRKKLDSTQHLEAERVYRFHNTLNALEIAQKTTVLLILASEVLQEYSKQKERVSALDYDDLIDYTKALLNKPGSAAWVLYKLDGGIDHILIDEAQDTSPSQWQIIQSLTEEFLTADKPYRTIFVVGDAKQSIYSFQGASPEEFIRLRQHFAQSSSAMGQTWRDVSLSVSFRSTPAILDIVDDLFSCEIKRQGVAFEEDKIVHHAFRATHPGYVEVWPLLQELEKEKEQKPWPLPIKRMTDDQPEQRLAQVITRKIQELLSSGRILPSTQHLIQPKDILILVRKRTQFNRFLIQELKNAGIPVAGADRFILTDHIAVMDLLALGEFLILPNNDLMLACVLKSPLVGLSEDELFELAHGRSGTLWGELIQRKENPGAFQRAYTFLQDLLDQVDIIPLYELYHRALTVGQGRHNFIARLGSECEDALDEFLAQAIDFDRENMPSLQGFIQFFKNQVLEIKRDSSDLQNNQVRIMTVHGAKGLQAPIVILSEHVNRRDNIDKLLWEKNQTGQPHMVVLRPSQGEDCPYTVRLKVEQAHREDQEDRRLLYVALTRAQDQLFVCGYQTGKDIPEDSWYSLILETLKEKTIQKDDGSYRYQPLPDPQIIGVKLDDSPLELLPNWIKEKPLFPVKLGKQREPSSAEKTEAMERGVALHRLFEVLPDFPRGQWATVVETQISNQWKEDIPKVFEILNHPEYSKFFGCQSLAEVSVQGTVDGLPFLGRIDRLVVLEDTIVIIDYKTGVMPDQLPSSYRAQLKSYVDVLAPLYPTHRFKTFLLWVDVPKLVEVTLDLC